MRGVVEYNPAARAKPPRLVRESSPTTVFEEAEIVAFFDSISLESLKDIRGGLKAFLKQQHFCSPIESGLVAAEATVDCK
jgi:hypothetical protein